MRRWLKPSRLIPFLTVLGAGTAVVLSLIDIIELSLAEDIVISLVGLLAADALTERLEILEKIEKRLRTLSGEHSLRTRAELPPVEEQAKHASEICILAVSAISLSVRHLGFFMKKIREGCNLRILLLNPNTASLQTWYLQNKFATVESDIQSTLGSLGKLVTTTESAGRCEIRLLDVFLPFSMFGVDLQRESGSMVVEYHGYGMPLSELPHVFLSPHDSPHWFDHYRRQFEQAWSEGTTWIP